MKIIYCIAGTFNSGGMERVLSNKANFLVRHGYEVHIITSDQAGRAPYFPLDERIVQHDLGINYFFNNDKSLWRKILSYPAKQRRHKKALGALLNSLQADIVISMFDHEVSFLHKIKDGSKKIVEIHFSRFKRVQYGRKGLFGAIDRWRSKQDLALAQKYARFVVLTEEDKGYWGDLENIRVIPNANTFTPTNTALLENKRAIAVGRYDYQKGFDDLIEAWRDVHKAHPDWVLYIYGQGVLKESFEKLIAEYQLKDKVLLCPPTKDIEKAYLESGIALMTSRYEGLPMALLEAQVCGVPMVSYACKCGPKDIIQDGVNGFLIAEGAKQDFAQKVNQLIEDQALRKEMGNNARLMSERFSEARVMQCWVDLFKELMQSR